MTKTQQEFDRVVRYAGRWGVQVVFDSPSLPTVGELWSTAPEDAEYSEDNAPTWSNGPTDEVLIHWPTRTIHWKSSDKGTLLHDSALALLHELNHCLQKACPDDINEVESAMLAFEYYSVRFLKLSGWKAWMQDFNVPLPRTWGGWGGWSKATHTEKHKLLVKSREIAQHVGLLDDALKPTYRRPSYMPSNDLSLTLEGGLPECPVYRALRPLAFVD